MENIAKLLTSIAGLVEAAAWPAIFLVSIVMFRSELGQTLRNLSILVGRLRKAAFPGMSLELDLLADAEAASDTEKGGKITPRQIEAAARIKIKARHIDDQEITDELDKLCLEYDSIRRTLKAGTERTRAMTRVLVKMRSLAPSATKYLDVYKNSGSPGSRLAAIAIMQMVPKCADLDWLRERFSLEQPFVFYHASLALQNLANILETGEEKRHLRDATQEALDAINGFQGVPDRNTIEVLSNLLNGLKRHQESK